MARRPRRPVKASVKAAADRAEKRLRGASEEDIEATKAAEEHTPLDPPEAGKKIGRPTKYKTEFAKQAAKLCKLGATDADLSKFFEISTSTLWLWQVTYPSFSSAIKLSRVEADARVERSLYQRAIGYEYDAVKIFQHEGSIIEAPYREKAAPETAACIFWLKNRKPAEWRDKVDAEITGNLTINISKNPHRKEAA